MKRGQKGFGAIEGMLIVVIVLLLGFIGYYVYHSQKNTNASYNSAAKSSDSTATDPYAGWKTYTGKVSADAQNPAVQADQVAYSLKYPGDWAFYPIGTMETVSGHTGADSFQSIAPSLGSNKAIRFNSISTTKTAQDYYTAAVGDQSGLSGPTWQGVGVVKTQAGYSGYTSKLDAPTGTVYETYISNNKNGLVDFNYGAAMASDSSTLKQIFNSVTIP